MRRTAPRAAREDDSALGLIDRGDMPPGELPGDRLRLADVVAPPCPVRTVAALREIVSNEAFRPLAAARS
jgi:hypothetical protein